MTDTRWTSERAREAGRKGGRYKKPRPPTLAEIELLLPPLDSIESAMTRLDMVGKWALAGMVAGGVAGAAVRSVEVWLKAQDSQLTQKVVTELKADLDRVKAELKQRRGSVVRAVR